VDASSWDDSQVNSCRALANVFQESFTAFMDAYMDRRLPGIEELLTQLLVCAQFPADFSVARIPLDAFYELTLVLSTMDEFDPGRNEDENPAGGNFDTVAAFKPYFQNLLETCMTHVRLDDKELGTWEPLDEDIFRERKDWKESIGNCCTILGGVECLRILHTAVLSDPSPSTVEACFFALGRISDFLPQREMQYLPSFVEALTTLPAVPKLTLASIKFLGNISGWVGSKQMYVERFVPMLMEGMQQPNLSDVAAESLRGICNASGVTHGLPILAINEKLVELRRQGGILSTDADNFVLEGLSTAISKVRPYEAGSAMLSAVYQPISAILTPEHIVSMSIADVTAVIEKITTLVDFYDVPATAFEGANEHHPVLLIFEASWSFLQYTLSAGTQVELHEKVTRFYKHVIRRVGAHAFSPRLPDMLSHLVAQYNSTKCFSYLYLGAVCTKDFAHISNGRFQDALCEMLSQFSHTFFSTYSNPELLFKAPDAVEEYLYLVGIGFATFPKKIVHASSMMEQLVQCAITTLDVPDQSVQRACMSFFRDLTRVATEDKESEATCAASKAMVEKYKMAVICGIVLNIAGKVPPFAVCLERGDGSYHGVLWELKVVIGDSSFTECLETAATALPANCLKYTNVLSKATRARSATEIRSVLIDFERCIRIW
jgi:hypothetical protein